MNIGRAIVAIRKKKGIKQKELAKMIGVSTNALLSLENGKSWPTMATINKITESLSLPQSYLMLYSIEDGDIPKQYNQLLKPLQEYLL